MFLQEVREMLLWPSTAVKGPWALLLLLLLLLLRPMVIIGCPEQPGGWREASRSAGVEDDRARSSRAPSLKSSLNSLKRKSIEVVVAAKRGGTLPLLWPSLDEENETYQFWQKILTQLRSRSAAAFRDVGRKTLRAV